MVILLISILSAVALPNFFDFRTDARNSATFGALGGVRAAVAVARASISLKEAIGVPAYPTYAELTANQYAAGSHPVLAALASNFILDASAGIPVNPWSLSTVPISQWNSIWDCSALVKGALDNTVGHQNIGWCYNQNNGQFWANSDLNGSVPTENNY